jgi:hypothetical protein
MKNFTQKLSRLLFIIALLVCTQGTECGSSNSGSSSGSSQNSTGQEVNGGDATGQPPPGSTTQLVTLINNGRTSAGQQALTENPIADQVATDYANAWAAASYSPTFSFDVVGDLASKGATVTVGSSSNTAAGFATAQSVYTSLQAQNPFSNGAYSNIGVSLTQPGAGNYWVIIQY